MREEMQTKALGFHILLDFHDCNSELINDLDYLRKIGREAARIAKLRVIGENSHQFHPQGATVILMIEESHISFHSWPEHRYLAVDIFTCGSIPAARQAADFLRKKMGCRQVIVKELLRGLF